MRYFDWLTLTLTVIVNFNYLTPGPGLKILKIVFKLCNPEKGSRFIQSEPLQVKSFALGANFIKNMFIERKKSIKNL